MSCLINTIIGVLILLLYSPTSAQAAWFKQQKDIMGTRVSIELWHSNAAQAKSCGDKIFAEMQRIDAMMSPYRADSELSFINNNASVSSVDISVEMSQIIDRSLYFSQLSGGAFDITFASVGYQYDYRNKIKPSDQFIQLKLPAIDYRHIRLGKQRIYFNNASVRIDLGGIAKGYAVDQAMQIVRSCGIREAMISAGGDSRVLGTKRGKPWIIGIQHPRNKDDLALIIPLSDTAISTSGDYQRFFIEDGIRIHHIIDPATGRSTTSTWSATVTGPDAITTDALSTTIFVLGAEKGMALIETLQDIEAVIIDSNGQIHYSSGFQEPVTLDSPAATTEADLGMWRKQ